MEPDDEVCLCFHVTKRKIENYLRLEKPRRASQISECFGAGTGCGWCRPFLKRMFASTVSESSDVSSFGDKLPGSGGERVEADLENIESRSSAEQAPQNVDTLSADDYAQLRAEYVDRGEGTPPSGA